EPTAGMSAADVQRTIELVARVRAGRTVVLVEHNMGVVGELAGNVVVLQQGAIIAEGRYGDVRHDPAVVAAYLGQVDALEHRALRVVRRRASAPRSERARVAGW